MRKTTIRNWALWALVGCHGFAIAPSVLFAQEAQPAPAVAPDPAPAPAATYKSLTVYPPVIKISAQNDSQRFMAMATRTDGITVDVTEQVEWKLENPAFGRLENFTLYPVADGATHLIGTWNGMESRATFEVTQSDPSNGWI